MYGSDVWLSKLLGLFCKKDIDMLYDVWLPVYLGLFCREESICDVMYGSLKLRGLFRKRSFDMWYDVWLTKHLCLFCKKAIDIWYDAWLLTYLGLFCKKGIDIWYNVRVQSLLISHMWMSQVSYISISRLPKFRGLFCKRGPLKRALFKYTLFF